jgi:DNA-binding ferritin-like protein
MKKLKVGFLLEAFVDSIPIGLGKAEDLTALPDTSSLVDDPLKQAQADAMVVILSEWNILRGNFKTFHNKFSKLGEGKKKYRDAISETVMKIHDAIMGTLMGEQA